MTLRDLVLSLDRCEHGRHQKDDCYGCHEGNEGNPHLDDVIGWGVRGEPITPRLLLDAARASVTTPEDTHE